MDDDLTNVKVGDKVALVSMNHITNRINAITSTVERVTKTQVVALNGRKFRKSNGEEFGFSGSRFTVRARLCVVTPELLDEIEEGKEVSKAERKCRTWAEGLGKARNEDALRLAKMLPDIAVLKGGE